MYLLNDLRAFWHADCPLLYFKVPLPGHFIAIKASIKSGKAFCYISFEFNLLCLMCHQDCPAVQSWAWVSTSASSCQGQLGQLARRTVVVSP